MRMRAPVAIGGALLTATLLFGAGPAGATKNGPDVTVNCGSGPFAVTVGGNGDWTPARVNGSTAVLHPVSFGLFTGVFVPTGGPPQLVSEDPFARKNTPNNGKPLMKCSYHISFSDPGGTFSGDGTVVLWAS